MTPRKGRGGRANNHNHNHHQNQNHNNNHHLTNFINYNHNNQYLAQFPMVPQQIPITNYDSMDNTYYYSDNPPTTVTTTRTTSSSRTIQTHQRRTQHLRPPPPQPRRNIHPLPRTLRSHLHIQPGNYTMGKKRHRRHNVHLPTNPGLSRGKNDIASSCSTGADSTILISCC